MSSVTLLLGSQWGDEGKGKLTDYLLSATTFNVCARAQGGHNAGHTVKTGGQTYSFHLLPSGLVDPDTDNLIGSGVVFNVEAFFKELAELEAKGVPRVHERIHVSSRCHLNCAIHSAVDGLSEAELGKNQIGTTKRGIGPTYSTKASREGLRIIDLYHESFEARLRILVEGYRKRYGSLLKYSIEDEIEKFKKYREQLRPYVVDAVEYIRIAEEKKQSVLVEASQALLLDVDFGTYPFCTSSSCSTGGCISGLALNPFNIKHIIGVAKAYTTRVGAGPFPSEDGEAGKLLQEIGREIGVSTGRTRRCGWFDVIAVRYSASVNHYTCLALLKLDVLDTFPIIRVATAYTTPAGTTITTFPELSSDLENLKPVYEDFKGWQCSTKGTRRWEELPEQAKKYILFVEGLVGVKIKYIGTGPEREDIVVRD